MSDPYETGAAIRYFELWPRSGNGIAVTLDPPDDLDALRLLLDVVPSGLIEVLGGEWVLWSPAAARAVALACEMRDGFEAVDHHEPPLVFWPAGRGENASDRTGADADGWAEALFAALPEHLHTRAFRSLSRLLHPDHGGDAKLMRDLNDAHRTQREGRPGDA